MTSSSSYVFMSYSRKDEPVMRRTVAYLRRKGINVWVDNEKLIPGTPIWETEIEKAIVNAEAIVVLLSPSSKESPWVRREIGYAEDNDKRIFPIVIAGNDKDTIPIRLTNHQRIDIRKNENAGLDSLFFALSNYIDTVPPQHHQPPEFGWLKTNWLNFIKWIKTRRVRKLNLSFVSVILSIAIAIAGLALSFYPLVSLFTKSMTVKPEYSIFSGITINDTNFDKREFFLNGIQIDMKVDVTNGLERSPYQVVIYFRHRNNRDLIASRSFINLLSPYIAKDNTVSVYTDLRPTTNSSKWDISLFIPYSAIAASDLPEGATLLEFYAVLRYKDTNEAIAVSDVIPFTYTR